MPAAHWTRSPVPELPCVHQIVLPTPWEVGPVQVYLVEGEPLTLVDTGVREPSSWEALGAALEGLGFAFEDLRRVILTHWHGDHLGQARRLREASPELEVWTHRDEAVWCEEFSPERDLDIEGTELLFREYGVPEEILSRQSAMRRGWLSDDPLCGPCPVDRVLGDGDRVAFKEFAFEVIHAPGHTEGHLLLHEPGSGVLITGDHLMGNAVPFTTNHYTDGLPAPADPLHRRPRFRGLPRYMASLRALRAMRFRAILPAHGGVVSQPGSSIREALLFYEVRIQRIERALRQATASAGWASAWEIWQRVFPKTDPVREMRNRMTMVIGALDLFEDEARVAVDRRDDGVLIFRPLEPGS
jgi:glyoxylase-like metal-dependent hydrolase (beta-lactamase superfamily II)